MGYPAALTRRPLEGVGNILRFNWPFYAAAAAGVAAAVVLSTLLPGIFRTLFIVAAGLAAGVALASLLVSAFIYDVSPLYRLRWLDALGFGGARLVNIHAGFDETSALLRAKYPAATLRVLDFYDPAKHTEASIRRARAYRPPYPGTQAMSTAAVPLARASTDGILLLFSAHEIRDPAERTAFFAQLRTALAPGGKIVVLEHLRDVPNFLAYTLGAFHFHSYHTWTKTCAGAGLRIASERKVTPFVRAFLLNAYGSSS